MSDSLYVKVGDSVEALDLGTGGGTAPEYVERIETLEAEALGVKADTVLAAQNAADVSGGSLGDADLNQILSAYEMTQAEVQSVRGEVQEGYLPLAGGTITGPIRVKGIYAVQGADDGAGLFFSAAKEAPVGASLYLYRADQSSSSAAFSLRCRDGENDKGFIGKPDGALTWGGDPVVVLTESWRSGNSWYRKYSDGWIEQGGTLTKDYNTKVTFNLAFTTVGSINVLASVATNYGSNDYVIRTHNWTVSGFNVSASNGGGGTRGDTKFAWYACGY